MHPTRAELFAKQLSVNQSRRKSESSQTTFNSQTFLPTETLAIRIFLGVQ
jgi:hypothetical protein